jgi:predicted nucleotidyltransferase
MLDAEMLDNYLAYPKLTEAAAMLGVSTSTLSRRRLKGIRVGGREQRLRPSEVMAEAAYHKRRPPELVANDLVSYARAHAPHDADVVEVEVRRAMSDNAVLHGTPPDSVRKRQTLDPLRTMPIVATMKSDQRHQPQERARAFVPTMVDVIAKRFEPLRIVLFGSQARGDERPDSDVDLMIVMPDGTDRRKTAVAIRVALWDIRAPKDVVVVTKSDVEWSRDMPGSIIRHALEEGMVVYESH